MQPSAASVDWPPFRVTLAYTQADLAAYEQIILRRQRAPDYGIKFWGLIGTGFATGLIGAWLIRENWAIRGSGTGLIAVLIFVAFWLGAWSPGIWRSRHARRMRARQRSEFAERYKDALLLFTAKGIVLRLPQIRAFYRFSSVKAATMEQGLLLLWTGSQSAIAIPARLLEPAQQKLLLSLWQKTA